LSDVVAALRRTAARYRGCARFTRHYVASKLRHDPIHLALLGLAREAPFGHVVDVGCGRGQLSVALLEAGLASSVTGLDRAGGSLADLERASAGLAVEIIARDLASDFRVPAGDTVLIVDVLYLMEQKAALALLKAAADAARERILVRSLDAAAGWRGQFSLLIERLARPFWPHAGRTVDPLPLGDLTGVLKDSGFAVQTQPCWGRTPFANVLIVGKRKMRHPQGTHHCR
jgi:SAM-dependent methyltransferase